MTADPTAVIHRAADLREQRISYVAHFDSPWTPTGTDPENTVVRYATDHPQAGFLARVADYGNWALAEHIAAEANPAHALAEVALWRGIFNRHARCPADGGQCDCAGCTCGRTWPCPDIQAVHAAAAAYLGETT